MGKDVIVDSDDLEVLLFSTGAIKDLETALQMRKHDPLVKQSSGRLKDAHDALSAQWRRAVRDQRQLPSDDPIDETCGADLLELCLFSTDGVGAPPHGYVLFRVAYRTAKDGKPADFMPGLRRRGMIDVGSMFEEIFWGDAQKVDRIDRATFAIKLTARGREAACRRFNLKPYN